VGADDRVTLSRERFARLLELLREDGYQLVGPTVRDGAVVHEAIRGIDDLPEGWTDAQEGGTYRLVRRNDRALFGYSVGPQSYKPFFFAATVSLWRARRRDGSFVVLDKTRNVPRLALIGARSCDLHGLAIQDKILLEGRFADP
jgi:hypothetical protein